MKKHLCAGPLVLLFCFAFACQDKAAMVELEKFRAQAKVEERNKALVNRLWEAWNKKDFETVKEMRTPDYLWYLPSNSTEPISREEGLEKVKRFHSIFPDINFSIEEVIAVGDKVISRYIMRGTHQGEFQGIPATGNKVEISGITISRIENGKIVEEREERDMLGFMQQLGMELKPIETNAIQAQTPPQAQTESVEQELIKLENDWLQAFFENDDAFADRFLADDYLGTDEHGNIKNKAQEIAEIKVGAHLSTSGVLDNIRVRVYGDAAVVTGRRIMKGLFQGKEYRSPYLWTDIFIKRGGRWQCVASHASKAIPQGK